MRKRREREERREKERKREKEREKREKEREEREKRERKKENPSFAIKIIFRKICGFTFIYFFLFNKKINKKIRNKK